ncbi:MAG TPA: type II toxin-antitoxin system RelE/ParE family toxin [Methanolinea sp.]|nr:type II toxin-antitoxin system RelE/ParE family toxin [Methanolinea sp.]
MRKSLTCLEEDPYAPRAHADIKPLKDTHPQKYRLRVGNFRIVYVVEGNKVRILDVLHRGRGYSGQ